MHCRLGHMFQVASALAHFCLSVGPCVVLYVTALFRILGPPLPGEEAAGRSHAEQQETIGSQLVHEKRDRSGFSKLVSYSHLVPKAAWPLIAIRPRYP